MDEVATLVDLAKKGIVSPGGFLRSVERVVNQVNAPGKRKRTDSPETPADHKASASADQSEAPQQQAREQQAREQPCTAPRVVEHPPAPRCQLTLAHFGARKFVKTNR